jgi:Fe-S-cluster-containing hydrogenase component 2
VKKVLEIVSEKCVGCRICENACSFWHYSQFIPSKSRVVIFRDEKLGFSVPITCRQCEKPPCAEACPVGAFSRDAKTHAMIIDHDVCIDCRLCVEACPFGAITLEPDGGSVIKCDLCGGEPQCAKYCPTATIRYVRLSQVGASKRKEIAEKSMKFRKEILAVEEV